MRRLLAASLLIALSGFLWASDIPKKSEEVFDFKIDKEAIRGRAVENLLKDSPASENDFDFENLLLSSINGKDCEGKPARYIIALTGARSIPGFRKYIIYQISTNDKLSTFTIGSTHDPLKSLIRERRLGLCDC